MRLAPLLVLLAAPAAAQWTSPPRMPVAGPGPGGRSAETGDTFRRIRDGQRSGQLSRHEAKLLRRQAGFVDTLGQRYARDGLSDAEARELAARDAVLRDEVNNRRAGAGPGAGSQPKP